MLLCHLHFQPEAAAAAPAKFEMPSKMRLHSTFPTLYRLFLSLSSATLALSSLMLLLLHLLFLFSYLLQLVSIDHWASIIYLLYLETHWSQGLTPCVTSLVMLHSFRLSPRHNDKDTRRGERERGLCCCSYPWTVRFFLFLLPRSLDCNLA